MNYNLNTQANSSESPKKDSKKYRNLITLLPMADRGRIVLALVALLVNAICTLIAPYIIGLAVDKYVSHKNIDGLLRYSLVLMAVFIVAFIANYLQIRIMGGVGQRTLALLRRSVFQKIQSLPLAFFTQNKAGDLISRINNDTEKLSQFFSETFTRFIGGVFMVGGAAVFLVSIQWNLGVTTLLPAILLLIITKFIGGFVSKSNTQSLRTTGDLSGEIQESLQNFKVVVVFDRQDYFRKKFAVANDKNYIANMRAGWWNGIFSPLYDLAANLGQLAVLAYGIYLIISGQVSIGILVSFLAYAERFYNPLRQMAQLWANVQVAMAAWERVHTILSLENNMDIIALDSPSDNDSQEIVSNQTVLECRDVSFKYPDSSEYVLQDINMTLERGKTYALVGPTGGGKTTIASIMARLYDPTDGLVLLNGKDIRSYVNSDRVMHIGFILQDPVVFAGTVAENITYGNTQLEDFSIESLQQTLDEYELSDLLTLFSEGLETVIPPYADSVSLGQKQIIAFMRAILRKPDLLILDEATANIDTVTEKILDRIVKALPPLTAKVIIAHRLNTIKDADTIYFVNGGTVKRAGNIDEAIAMLLHVKRNT